MITRDEWLKALGDAAAPTDPDALTVRELAEMCGVDRRVMDERVRELVAQGKAARTAKIVRNAAGQNRRVSAYRLLTQ